MAVTPASSGRLGASQCRGMDGGTRSPGTGGSRYARRAGAACMASPPLLAVSWKHPFFFSSCFFICQSLTRCFWLVETVAGNIFPQQHLGTMGFPVPPPPLSSIPSLSLLNNQVHDLESFGFVLFFCPRSFNQRAAIRQKISWDACFINHR